MSDSPTFRRVLAIDTATRIQTLALLDGDAVLARRLHQVKFNQASTLLHNIGDMLGQHDLSPRDLDLICVGVGPGSFTSLRVGLANAKGLARAAGCALAGVSSLEAVARPACYMHDGPVVATIDARRGEVYAGVYRGRGEGFEALIADHTATPSALKARLEEEFAGQAIVASGTGVRAYPELSGWDAPNVRVLDAAWDAPSSVSVALLGRARALRDGPDDLARLEPNYIRLSDAELTWKQKNATAVPDEAR